MRRAHLAVTALTLVALAIWAAPSPASAEQIKAVFNCEDGTKLDVTFDNDADPNTAIVTIEGKEPVTLPIAMSGSGYYYSNGPMGLRGKGDEATWEVGRKAPVNCTAEK
jgi:membrane-bound inhibitor of C-type lysozyme